MHTFTILLNGDHRLHRAEVEQVNVGVGIEGGCPIFREAKGGGRTARADSHLNFFIFPRISLDPHVT